MLLGSLQGLRIISCRLVGLGQQFRSLAHEFLDG
jgi:hypothetical protein